MNNGVRRTTRRANTHSYGAFATTPLPPFLPLDCTVVTDRQTRARTVGRGTTGTLQSLASLKVGAHGRFGDVFKFCRVGDLILVAAGQGDAAIRGAAVAVQMRASGVRRALGKVLFATVQKDIITLWEDKNKKRGGRIDEILLHHFQINATRESL